MWPTRGTMYKRSKLVSRLKVNLLVNSHEITIYVYLIPNMHHTKGLPMLKPVPRPHFRLKNILKFLSDIRNNSYLLKILINS